MARAIRFVKAEREWLASFIGPQSKVDSKGGRLAQSVLTKLAESEAPLEKSRSHLTVQDAVSAFRSVLERRLIPPMGTAFVKMQAQLKSLGLTREQCELAAQQAGREWKGSIRAQSILNQAERLLHNAESEPLPMEGRVDRATDTMTDL